MASEVTLLPRHWEWLAAQPGGASVALRKLVEAARKSPKADADRARAAADRFMMAALGDAPAPGGVGASWRAWTGRSVLLVLAVADAGGDEVQHILRRVALRGGRVRDVLRGPFGPRRLARHPSEPLQADAIDRG